MKKDKEEDFLFSKELRDGLAEFEDMEVTEALKSPDFFNAILGVSGLSKEEQKDLWNYVGRPDCFEE